MRGQLMLEFVVLIGVSMLILGIAVSVIVSEASKASQMRHESAVHEQHERLRSELFAAYLATDGYTTQIEFSPPYRGVHMNLSIENNAIRIESERTASGSTLIGVNGSVHLSEGTITLVKENGSVIAT